MTIVPRNADGPVDVAVSALAALRAGGARATGPTDKIRVEFAGYSGERVLHEALTERWRRTLAGQAAGTAARDAPPVPSALQQKTLPLAGQASRQVTITFVVPIVGSGQGRVAYAGVRRWPIDVPWDGTDDVTLQAGLLLAGKDELEIDIVLPRSTEYDEAPACVAHAISIASRPVVIALTVPLVTRVGGSLGAVVRDIPLDLPYGASGEIATLRETIVVGGTEYPLELPIPLDEDMPTRMPYTLRPLTVERVTTEELEIVRDDFGRAKGMLRHWYPAVPNPHGDASLGARADASGA